MKKHQLISYAKTVPSAYGLWSVMNLQRFL